MASRSRKESESYKQYRKNLKAEAEVLKDYVSGTIRQGMVTVTYREACRRLAMLKLNYSNQHGV